MRIGRFFKSMINGEVLGEETVSTQETVYTSMKQQYPTEEPHTLLARVWMGRMAAKGGIGDMDAEMLMTVAMSETQQFACIPAPGNARALGLYFIYKQNPDILQRFPKFSQEFDRLMSPVISAMADGQCEALYRKYNPTIGWQFIVA